MAGLQGTMPLLMFRNLRIFRDLSALSESFRTFAVGKEKNFEFDRKIIEPGSSTLQVP